MNVGKLNAEIGLNVADFNRGVDKVTRGFNTIGANAVKVNQTLELMGRATRAISEGFKKAYAPIIKAADTSEKYRLTLDALLGSQKEGARAFEEMAAFAGKVPFEYEKIMDSAVALSGVMKGGVDEISQWMPMISDLAAVTRLSIEDTTQQVIRMYSAGAASADLFRERGVLAMLGFQAGVSYSAEETRKKLIQAFEDPESQFRGSSAKLAETWSGLLSMVSDKVFQIKNKIAEAGMFEDAKGLVDSLLESLQELEKQGVIDDIAEDVSKLLSGSIALAKILTENLAKVGETYQTLREHAKTIVDDKDNREIIERSVPGYTEIKAAWAVPTYLKAYREIREGTISLSDLFSKNSQELDELITKAEEARSKTFELFLDDERLFERIESAFSSANEEAEAIAKYLSGMGEMHKASVASEHDFDTGPGLKAFGEMIDDLKVEKSIATLQGVSLELAKIDVEVDKLMEKYRAAENIDLSKQAEQVRSLRKDIVLDKAEATITSGLKDELEVLQNQKAVSGLGEMAADMKLIDIEAGRVIEQFGELDRKAPTTLINGVRDLKKELVMSEEVRNLENMIAEQTDKLSLSQKVFGADILESSLVRVDVSLKSIRRQFEGIEDVRIDGLLNQLEQAMKQGVTQEVITNTKQHLNNIINYHERQIELATMNPHEQHLQRVAWQIEDLKNKYSSLGEKDEDIQKLIDKLEELLNKTKDIGVSFDYAARQMEHSIRGAFHSMTGPLQEFLQTFAETGKLAVKDLVENLVKQLQIYAAARTARLLMEAAFHGVMALVDEGGGHGAKAMAALKGAGIMGSFVAGSGLAGMAHDGITEIPEDGSWFLKKKERVVDADTNKDLKEYLKDGGGKTVNFEQKVEINGGDEQSVLRALPAMKQAALEAVNESICSGGVINSSIKTYAS